MIEFEWEKKGQRAEAAALLRELADSLEGDGEVELEHGGWELKFQVPEEVEFGVELEVEEDETELEIEIKWSRRPDGGASGTGTGAGDD